MIDGVDGCGKTTQVRLLMESLERIGRMVHVTAEPTKGPMGQMVRDHLQRRLRKPLPEWCLASLIHSDRLWHLLEPDSGILTTLNRSTDVICERYVLSTHVYESLRAGYDASRMDTIVQNIFECEPPDVTFLLQMDPAKALARSTKRWSAGALSLEKLRSPTLQGEIELAFARAVKFYKSWDNYIVSVDADRPCDEVAGEIYRTVAQLIGLPA